VQPVAAIAGPGPVAAAVTRPVAPVVEEVPAGRDARG
jgi:hypothetical protein